MIRCNETRQPQFKIIRYLDGVGYTSYHEEPCKRKVILFRQGVKIYKSFGVIFLTFTDNITVSFSCFYCQF